MFTITIGKADTSCPDKITLTSGMVNAVQVAFAFSEEWEGFDKIAVFSNGATTVDVTLDEKDRCYVPHEVLSVAGRDVNVGVYGSKGEGEDYVAIPTEKCSLGKVSEGVDPSGEESAEPTPTIWDDLNIRVGNLETRMDKHTHDVASYSYEDVSISGLTIVEPFGGYASVSDDGLITIGGASEDYPLEINYSGYANIELLVTSADDNTRVSSIRIDDKDIYSKIPELNDVIKYSGNIENGIKISGSFLTLKIVEFNNGVITGKNGLMTPMQAEKLDTLSESLGDIDTALDELHAYAQGLISGGVS